MAVGFVQLLASMLSGLLIDTVGRIPLLIISSVFMSLALASFGSYVYYEQAHKLMVTNSFDLETTSVNSDWIPLLCVLVFTIAFSLGKNKYFVIFSIRHDVIRFYFNLFRLRFYLMINYEYL